MTPLAFVRRSRARGYTMMELVIALGIGVAILLALMLMFSRNSGNQQEVERTLRQIENARFAVDSLTEDVLHAGFYSDFNPDLVDPRTYTSPSPCAEALTALGWNAAVSPMELPRPVQGILADTVIACLPDRRGGTEALVIRRAETGPTIGWAAGRADNLYIQASRCPDDADRIRVSSVPATDPQLTFNLRTPNCANPNNALRRLLQRTYYVATCNDCANDEVPTLKRVEMVNGRLRTTAIAEGVENLQFEFGVDTNEDGRPDDTLRTATLNENEVKSQGKTEAELRVAPIWRNVVSVRMHVLTRGTQRTSGFEETRTFLLGPTVSLTPKWLNDDAPLEDRCVRDVVTAVPTCFKRSLLSTTVRLNNVGSRRE